ncbi:mediator of RNA polymerase II transcription subunit 14 [Lingula anatina]|uniref:Mediator of RNA polymerase II transcription subunit 14 n=1 Tax=Lingula anatina TaxID=7574 RepID=A0A1S3JL19_LINAN|nr:mediator of RNA polymerase II transcription subunit 14 [Lingula anatina]|eukprot:XP_013410599.1 mediator of RNA polymerase II transcription subunit 14 [Lingula anatina]
MPPIEGQPPGPGGAGALAQPGPGTIPLATLIDFILQRTYHELSVLSELLPRKTDMERKIEIVQFASRTRQLFVRLLALVKWANSASKVDKCAAISSFLDKQAMLFVDTADMLAKVAHETRMSARLPAFSIPCAIDVLTTGTYPRLPTCVKERIVPADPISPIEKRETLQRLNQIIEYRLVTSDLPPQMKKLKIANGRVKFLVEHEFEITLTLMGDGPSIPWRLLDIDILVEDHETGDGKALVHTLQVNYIHQLVQSRLLDNDRPLHDLYNCLHSFSQSLQLEVLHSQAERLRSQRLGDHIRVEEYTAGRSLVVSYWRLQVKRDTKPADQPPVYKLSIHVDEADPGKPLQVTHTPEIQGKESYRVAQAIKSDHLSIEKLLIQTIQVRSQARLRELEKDVKKFAGGPCEIKGVPPTLLVPVLFPCMDSEKMLISVDIQRGLFLTSMPQYGAKCKVADDIEESLNSGGRELARLMTELRIWLGIQRCEKSIQHLPAAAYSFIPLTQYAGHPIENLGPWKLYIKLLKQANFYVVVDIQAKGIKAIEYNYYLLQVEPCTFEKAENEIMDDIPTAYLRPKVITKFDTYAITHGPLAKIHDAEVDENEEESLERKRKILQGDVDGPPRKQARVAAYFVSELVHILAATEDRIPFVNLGQELQNRGIGHQGVQVDGNGSCYALTVVDIPCSADTEALKQDLLSCTFRVQGKTRSWHTELVFTNCPVMSTSPKEKSIIHRVVCMYELSHDGDASKLVQDFMDDWATLGHLYKAVLDFSIQYKNPSTHLHNMVEIKSYSYKRLVLGYGPSKLCSVNIQWSRDRTQFVLAFGTCGPSNTANPHTLVATQLQAEFNKHKSIATLAQTLHETWMPMAAICKLHTTPFMAQAPKAQAASVPQPNPLFSVIPQSSTHIRIGYRNTYPWWCMRESAKCKVADDIEESLNSGGRELARLMTELRIWLGIQRCEKSIQHLPAAAYSFIPLTQYAGHPIENLGPWKLYIKLLKQANFYVVVDIQAKGIKAIEYNYYLLQVEPCTFEKAENEIMDDIPTAYLRPKVITKFDTYAITHGPLAKIHDAEVDENEEESLERKRKILQGDVDGPPRKQARVAAYFVSELVHILAATEDRIPFVNLGQELQNRGIGHQGVQVDGNGSCYALTVVDIPCSADTEALKQDLLSCTFRVQGKTRSWHTELVFTNCPVMSTSPKEKSIIHRVVCMYELSHDGDASKLVQDFMDDWATLGHLYKAVLDFSIQYKNPSTHLHNMVEIKNYSYKRLVLGYGPSKLCSVNIQWSRDRTQFVLAFGTCGPSNTANPHTLVATQLQAEFNKHKSIATLAQTLHETWMPMAAICKLHTTPFMAQAPKAQAASVPQPNPLFSVIPQSSTHIRIGYRNTYCLDIHLRSNKMVSVRDGAYSWFDTSKVVEGFTPTPGLKTFLNHFVEEGVPSGMSRRRSTTEDDNPPSPVGMDSMETFMNQPQQIGSPVKKQDGGSGGGLRFPGPMTPPSNPHTPASPSGARLGQSGYSASPAAAFPLASPPSLQMGTPSPGNVLGVSSPGNPQLHVPSPGSFVPAPSPSSLGIHMPSPATAFISPQDCGLSYCLDIHLRSNKMVSVRDGAYSWFDTSKVVEGFTPTPGLKTFLNHFVEEGVPSGMSRRRSTTEDDNPPSPVGMDSMETFMNQPQQIGSPVKKQDGGSGGGLRFPGPMTPPSNPHTPASPSGARLGQSGYSASPAAAFPLASPPSLQMGTPSPGNVLGVSSPGNPQLHVPSPGSFVPAPSPSSLGIHMPSPATAFISPQGMLEGGSPYHGGGLVTPSPGPRNWPGSPSPASRHGTAHSPGAGHQALHSPPNRDLVMSPPSRMLPQRSWAASIPTLLTHEALNKLLTPTSTPGQGPGLGFLPCCPLQRFLGCVFLKRSLQRIVQTDDALQHIPPTEPGVVMFKSDSMQFRVALNPNTQQVLQMKITPSIDQWSHDELQVLERFFEVRVTCPPYKLYAVTAFTKLLAAPPRILKDCVQLMRLELMPDRSFKWGVHWCLTSAASSSPIVAGAPAVLIKGNKMLFMIQLTRMSAPPTPGGSDQQSIVIPILYDINTNITSMVDQSRNQPQGSSPQAMAVMNMLKRFTEYHANSAECSIFPAVRELMANLILPV